MKKVKVMLSAIAIFAVVGGALAFKANTVNSFVYTTTDESAINPTCPFATPNTALTITSTGALISVTDVQGAACVLTFTTEQQ